MLVINFHKKVAVNFDKIDLMYLDGDKLILRYDAEHIAELTYATCDDAEVVFNEILAAYADGKKIFDLKIKE